MSDAPGEDGLPPALRFLKWLVIVLTLTMIGGVITVVWLLVTRMPQVLHASPTVPEAMQMPAGTTAQAVTFGTGWIAVVTDDNRILIFSPDGQLRQDIPVSLPPPPLP